MSAIPLPSQRNNFSVLWMRFIQKYQKNPTNEVWIFEGKDDIHFYSTRIERFYGTSPHKQAVIAEGKDNSLRLRESIKSNAIFRSAKVAFFIDQDFDNPDSLSGEDTYITPTYSIENLYYSESCMERFLTEKLHLFEEGDATDLSRALTKAIEWRDSAAATMAPYCAVLQLLKDKDEDQRKLATHIKERLIPDILQIKRCSGEVTVTISKKAIELCLEHTPPASITEDQIASVTSTWESKPLPLFRAIRGKFLIPHLHTSISLLIEDATRRSSQSVFSKRRPCSFQPRETELLQQLSAFAETPECLKKFLEDLKEKWSPKRSFA